MDCMTAEELIPEYIEGLLEPRRRSLLEDHLGGCARCSKYYREFLDLEESLRILREDLPDPSVIYDGLAGRLGLGGNRRPRPRLMSMPFAASFFLVLAAAALFIFRNSTGLHFTWFYSAYSSSVSGILDSAGAASAGFLSAFGEACSMAAADMADFCGRMTAYLGDLDLWIILTLSGGMTLAFLLASLHILKIMERE